MFVASSRDVRQQTTALLWNTADYSGLETNRVFLWFPQSSPPVFTCRPPPPPPPLLQHARWRLHSQKFGLLSTREKSIFQSAPPPPQPLPCRRHAPNALIVEQRAVRWGEGGDGTALDEEPGKPPPPLASISLCGSSARILAPLPGPADMIKETAAWLRRSSCEWNNRAEAEPSSPDGDEARGRGGEESQALLCDGEKIKDRR